MTEREKQEKIAAAAIRIAHAMKDYASVGEEDYFIVGRLLKDCMEIISNKLTPANQKKFAEWLIKKTKEGETNE